VNLTTAIEDGEAVAPTVAKLRARQQEREALLTEIGAAEAIGQLTIDRQTIERKVMEKITGWRTRLATDGRQVLREVLRGPLRFDPLWRPEAFRVGTRRSVVSVAARSLHTDRARPALRACRSRSKECDRLWPGLGRRRPPEG
jgi:hypothetical protein